MDYETVSALLRYEPDTGKLYWKVSRGNVLAGTEAGVKRKRGYRKVKIMGKLYMSHRLVWLFHNGDWPTHDLDHINHIRDDNRIKNLREAPDSVNQRNASLRHDNSSGLAGVHWREEHQRWLVQITLSGKRTHLGSFVNIFDAACAKKSAENRHGFHENHGLEASKIT